jgi:sec-independent protein translocase protein TatA
MFGIGNAAPHLFAFFGGIGTMELVIVGLIILILFGSRLPSVMRSLGQGVTEFKKGVQGIEDEKEEHTSEKA